MSRLSEALTGAGLSARVFHPGEIWLYPSQELFLSGDKLQARASETKPRPVIIVENEAHCSDPGYVTLLVVPTSHRVDLRNDSSLLLPAGSGNLAVDSLAQINIMQPVLKRDLGRRLGQLAESDLVKLLALIARTLAMGMVGDQD
jgi:mRNA-degrading endonuclease toxin of MazEF toxin-antitoxin module